MPQRGLSSSSCVVELADRFPPVLPCPALGLSYLYRRPQSGVNVCPGTRDARCDGGNYHKRNYVQTSQAVVRPPSTGEFPALDCASRDRAKCLFAAGLCAGNLINKPNSFKFEIDTPPQQSHCQIVRWLLRCVLLVVLRVVLLLLAINSRGSLLIN